MIGHAKASIATEGVATVDTGGVLDWFMVSDALANLTEAWTDTQAPIAVHRPVWISVTKAVKGDYGRRIKRPMALDGIPRRDLKGYKPEAGEFAFEADDLDRMWIEWHEACEGHLVFEGGVTLVIIWAGGKTWGMRMPPPRPCRCLTRSFR